MHFVLQDVGARPHMEDMFYVNESFVHDMSLYCLFDGHGGDFVAIWMREHYPSLLAEVLRKNDRSIPDMLFESLRLSVENMPRQEAHQCGSTYLICLKYGDLLFVANGGDCRAIMNANYEAIGITVDHKPGSKTEHDRIVGLGGFVSNEAGNVPRVNGHLAVSRGVGDFYMSPFFSWIPDIYAKKLEGMNNFVVMASDGIWDVMSNEDVNKAFIDRIVKNNGMITEDVLKEAMVLCLMECRKRGSGDNVTLVVFTL